MRTAKSQAGTANVQIEEVECEYRQYLDTSSLARAATLAQGLELERVIGTAPAPPGDKH